VSVNNFSQFMIAGTHSGSGKTTLTLGILRALTRRGLRTAPFKCGPDYIDPLFHRQAAGRPSINLDVYFRSHESYARYAHDADAAVTEGVMGLFDGTDPGTIRGSSAEIAALLRLPVILTVNAHGISGSIAPLVKGFSEWHPEVRIAGVIANDVGSARHTVLLREALERAQLPPLLGSLPRNERWKLPERHLGLSVGHLESEWLDALADELEKNLSLDLLLELTRSPRPNSTPLKLPPPRLRLGVALDEAFCFYYEENFELLRRNGVEIVPFSPLHDVTLPEKLNGIYLGGGYPELYAEGLSSNHAMLEAIRDFAQERLVYGECGGYIYLLEGLVDFNGKFHPCLGLLSGRAGMNRKLASLGYREVKGEWGTIRGHEFHYSSLLTPSKDTPLWQTTDLRGNCFPSGGIRGCVKGSYVHLHFASHPEALRAMVQELEK